MYVGVSDGRSGPSPFSFASTDALRHVELSDENKQKLERSKEEQRSEFDRKLMKLTASKLGVLSSCDIHYIGS